MKRRHLRTTKKKKWWKILLWVLFILIVIFWVLLYLYKKPYERIEYYPESDGNKPIKSILRVCKPSLLSLDAKVDYRLCWEAISYYKNWQIKEYFNPHGKYNYEYASYYENWQKKFECNFEKVTIEGKEWVYQYDSSIEPCIFYDENGQIQKTYWEGKIEKEYISNFESKTWEFPSIIWIWVIRVSYYDGNGYWEKAEYYDISSPFYGSLLERDIRTSDGITKEYYFSDWTLWRIEYYDKEWNLISTRLYETREYKNLDLHSKTFYTEDGEVEKIEKYVYEGRRKLIRVEEYDNEWYITHIERY